jgi:hypothetical protein
MNEKQIAALREVLTYLAEEKDDCEQFVANGGNPDRHIYAHIQTLSAFLKADEKETQHYSEIFYTNHGESK